MTSKLKKEKEEIVKGLRELVKQSEGVLLGDFTGIPVNEFNSLRRDLKRMGAKIKVAKNTFLRIAFSGTDYEVLNDYLKGSNMLITIPVDLVKVVKYLVDYKKEKGKEIYKVLKYGRKVVVGKDIERIAKLPSLEETRAMLVGYLTQPLGNLVGVLQGVLFNLVYVLEELKSRREEIKP